VIKNSQRPSCEGSVEQQNHCPIAIAYYFHSLLFASANPSLSLCANTFSLPVHELPIIKQAPDK
jgi:hypothetical protein